MRAFFRWFSKLTGVIPALVFFKPRVYKEKGKKEKGRGTLYVSNHKSLFDFPLMLLVFWYKSLHTLIAEVLYSKNAVLTFILNMLGGIKVERNEKRSDFIYRSEELLEKGKNLLIFPEGQLPRSNELGELHASWAYIALRSGAQVVPVVTDGNYGLFKRAGVMIGTPITDLYEFCGITKEDDASDAAKKANEKLREELIRLSRKLEEKKNGKR